MNSSNFDEEKAGPFVVCRKHKTCRMNCISACNTGKLKDPKKDEAWAKRWKTKYAKSPNAPGERLGQEARELKP